MPELLRQFYDYRMLIYAIVLILVMLATNSPFFRDLKGRFQEWLQERAMAKADAKAKGGQGRE